MPCPHFCFTCTAHDAIRTVHGEIMSTQNTYDSRLRQLANEPAERTAALVRSLLPGIETALASGQTLKRIWEALKSEGLQVSYHTFQSAVWREKQKGRSGNSRKRANASGACHADDKGSEATGERDPLANLKLLEENRPGFHWRATHKVS